MTIQNDFLPFAAGAGANVVPQSTYAGSGVQTQGFTAGVAPSNVINKPLRQMSLMASVMAQFIVQQTGNAVVDDGTTATLVANMTQAIKVLSAAPLYVNAPITIGFGTYDVDTSGGAFTLTLPASPAQGMIIRFRDLTGTWDTKPLTLARNGNTILGSATDLVCNVAGEDFEIWFNGSDWRIY